jgi:hypothetical protein
MNETLDLLYESSPNYSTEAIASRLTDLLASPESVVAIRERAGKILTENGVGHLISTDQATAAMHQIRVGNQGAGFDPISAAVLVSLTPLVKVLVPLLQPLADGAADVAKKIALDIWEMLKTDLLEKKKVRLREKSDPRGSTKKA